MQSLTHADLTVNGDSASSLNVAELPISIVVIDPIKINTIDGPIKLIGPICYYVGGSMFCIAP